MRFICTRCGLEYESEHNEGGLLPLFTDSRSLSRCTEPGGHDWRQRVAPIIVMRTRATKESGASSVYLSDCSISDEEDLSSCQSIEIHFTGARSARQ